MYSKQLNNNKLVFVEMSSNTITAAYGNAMESYRIMQYWPQYPGLVRTKRNRLKI